MSLLSFIRSFVAPMPLSGDTQLGTLPSFAPVPWHEEDGPYIPLGRTTTASVMGEPPAISHMMSVDRILNALRLAEAGECLELFSLYREIRLGHAHVQNLLNLRKLGVLTDALSIVPLDEDNPDDVKAAAAAKTLTQIPGWSTMGLNHLLNGHMYPLAILEQPYAIAPANKLGIRFAPTEFVPVPYHSLDWSMGYLQLWELDATYGNRTGNRREPVAGRHVVHRGHLLTDIPDKWGGPMRAALFWWLFAVMSRDWWVRFLDRMGIPLAVGKYDTSDTGSRDVLRSAFSQMKKLFGLITSKETDIEFHEVDTKGHGDAFQAIQTFANGELSKLILGQTMTVSAQAGGLGGGQAKVQENVQGSIKAWDLIALAETVNKDIIGFFLRINGFTGKAVLQVAADTTAEVTASAEFLTAAHNAGLEPTDDGLKILNKRSGIPLQRAATPVAAQPPQAVPALPLHAFSRLNEASAADVLRRLGLPTDDQLNRIASAGAPDLAAAFTGRYAPVRDIIAASTSAADLEHRLHVHFADTPASYLAPVLEDALTAFAATGAVSGFRAS